MMMMKEMQQSPESLDAQTLPGVFWLQGKCVQIVVWIFAQTSSSDLSYLHYSISYKLQSF